MKKSIWVYSIIGMSLLTGCGETLGNMMMKTGMTPDMKIVNDQKKVEQRLNDIAHHTIESTKLKPISTKKVIVFRDKTIPNFCQNVGWIIAVDKSGFNKSKKKKIGLFYNTVTTNLDIDALKKKAAKLGIEAIDVYPPMSNIENLTQYIGKYKAINYIISKHNISGTVIEYKKCSKVAETKCDKLLSDKSISRNLRQNKYYQCLINCSIKENHKPIKSTEIIYGGTALVCYPKSLEKIRKGETEIAAEIDYKVNKTIANIFMKKTSKKVHKNAKKKNIFKF